MKVTKFIGKKIHGFMDFEVDFKSNSTVLVGTNGTGKSTILNFLYALICPSFDYLCYSYFDSIETECIIKKNQIVRISAVTNVQFMSATIELNIVMINTLTNVVIFNITNVFEKIAEDKFRQKPLDNREVQRYYQSREYQIKLKKFQELDVVKKINSLSKPLFLSVERKIFMSDFTTSNYNESRDSRLMLDKEIIDNRLTDVDIVLKNYIALLNAKRIELEEESDRGAIHVVFNSNKKTINELLKKDTFRNNNEWSLETIETKSLKILQRINQPELTDSVVRYFNEAKDITQKYNDLKSIKDDEDAMSFLNVTISLIKIIDYLRSNDVYEKK
jgi:predicted ATP-binding protein involved in virulence